MKIVTVNVPESYVDAIEKLIGEDGLYPSRSELIRCAVRAFLIKELKMAEQIQKYSEQEIEELDDENLVKVPIGTKPGLNGEKTKVFKTYKILRRLEI